MADLLSTPDDDGIVLKQAADFFRARQVGAGANWSAGFSILIAISGTGTLKTTDGGEVALAAGDTILVPFTSGDAALVGDVTAYLCQPPQ